MLKDLVTEHFNVMFSLNKPRKNEKDLWLDKYKPEILSETAVHKAKILELETCLQRMLSEKASVVLLTGPSGSAKTTSLNLMAKKLNIEVQEWVNPVNEEYFSRDEEFMGDRVFGDSQQFKFSDFLFRASRYKSLCLSNETTHLHKISIVKDFPNFLLRDPSKLKELLLKHKSMASTNALVFVVTDTEQSSSVKRRLFPALLLSDLAIHVLKFNPIAPTSMMKALQRISNLASIQLPTKQDLEEIIEQSNGDVRSACNLLQFLCTKANKTDMKKIKKSKRVFKDKNKSFSKEKLTGVSLEPSSLGSKDVGISLFRVLGKILHCKRLPDTTTPTTTTPPTITLPDHLKQHRRARMSFDADKIFDKSCLSLDLFSSFLHQNYPPFFSSLEQMSMASECFSEADILSHEWSSRDKMVPYQASLLTRGLMFAHHPPSSKPAWMPLHKPQMLAVTTKKIELLHSIHDHFNHHGNHTHLYTEVLPFHALIRHPSFNSHQNNLLHRISHFSSLSRLERFEEGYDDDTTPDHYNFTTTTSALQSDLDPTIENLDDLIEDSDSDD